MLSFNDFNDFSLTWRMQCPSSYAETNTQLILNTLFNTEDYYEKIEKFAESKKLDLPKKLLGSGCIGFVLDAGDNVIKILTTIYNDANISRDLAFLKYLLKHQLPGFIQVDAILYLKVNYFKGNEYIKDRFLHDEIKWMNYLKDNTYLIWTKKIETDPDKIISSLSNYYKLHTNLIIEQFEIFGFYQRKLNKIILSNSGVDTYYSNEIRDSIGYEKYSTMINKIHNMLESIKQKTFLFDRIIESIQHLLHNDIIVDDIGSSDGDLHNIGMHYIDGKPELIIYDAFLMHMDVNY